MIKQRVRFMVFLTVSCILLRLTDAKAATYYTRSTGDITGSIWGTTTTGTGGALPGLANGDIIYIDDNITISTNYTGMDFDLTIYLNATVDITGGKWNLGVNSKVIFQSSSGRLLSTSGGNSDKVRFGNANTWSSSDPDLTGPGTLDKNYTPSGGLPVQLISFYAASESKSIRLLWSTASELNFDYFDIERSADASDFTSIGKVTGHGTSIVKNDYSLVDEKPLIGKNYYRLKCVDFDNYTEYFKVVAVDFSGEKNFLISPNPSDGTSLGFSLNFTPAGNSTIIVFDNLTNIIGVYKPSDYSQSILFGNSLRGGIYYAKIISDDFVKVERFVVR